MLLENDGKNHRRLDAAGLPDFVDTFVRERLYENTVDGLPDESELNSLAIWLLWLTTEGVFSALSSSSHPDTFARPSQSADTPTTCSDDEAHPAIRPHARSRESLSTLALSPPLTLPSTPHISLSTSTSPFPSNPTLTNFLTAHGPYPRYRDGFSRMMPLYHVNNIELSVPLASVAAKLIYSSHRQVFPVGVPPHLPRTRAHAFQLGLHMVGSTQEDVQELNGHKVVPK